MFRLWGAHFAGADPDAARTERLAQLLNKRLRGDHAYVEQPDPMIRAKHDRHLQVPRLVRDWVVEVLTLMQDVRQYYENEISALKQVGTLSDLCDDSHCSVQAANNAANAAVSTAANYEPHNASPPATRTSPIHPGEHTPSQPARTRLKLVTGPGLSPPLAPAPHPTGPTSSPLNQHIQELERERQQVEERAASQAAAFQGESSRSNTSWQSQHLALWRGSRFTGIELDGR